MTNKKPAPIVADSAGRPGEAKLKLPRTRRHAPAQLEALAKINAERQANAHGSTTKSFSLPDDVLEFVLSESKSRGVSQSALVTEALRLLSRMKEAELPSGPS